MIRIEPYEPNWVSEFQKLKEKLKRHIEKYIIRIEHVGSTSVKGLAAKPIIDIDMVIDSNDVLPTIIFELQKLGYTYVGEDGVPGRERFIYEDESVPYDESVKKWYKHHLYVCYKQSDGYLEHVNFRDYLRTHLEAVREYADLKYSLSKKYPNDIESYCNGKTEFIQKILKLSYTCIRRTKKSDRDLIRNLMEKYWGGEPLVVNGKSYYPSTLNGILLFNNEEVRGFLFYDVQENEYEIIVFEVFDKFSGLGTIMLNEFIRIVKDQNGDKILVMTTNDNLDALRFYQRRGFTIRGIRVNALEESRRMKPSIPLLGDYNIPLRDEIELELYVDNANESMALSISESDSDIYFNKQGEVFLETERLILRKLTPDDSTELCRILKDPKVMYAWEHEFTDVEVMEWINENIRRYQIDGYSYCAAISKKTHELIGLMGLLVENIDGKKYTGIGYILKKEHWRNGYALEGAKGYINYAFRVLNIEEIIADIRPENHNSQKVAERLGMKVIGQHTKRCYGKDMLHIIYGRQ